MKQRSDDQSRRRRALTALRDRLSQGNGPGRPSPSPVEQVLAALQPQIEELRSRLSPVAVLQEARPGDDAEGQAARARQSRPATADPIDDVTRRRYRTSSTSRYRAGH